MTSEPITPDTPILSAADLRFAHACLVITESHLGKVSFPMAHHKLHIDQSRHAARRARKLLEAVLAQNGIPPAVTLADDSLPEVLDAVARSQAPSKEPSNVVPSPLAN